MTPMLLVNERDPEIRIEIRLPTEPEAKKLALASVLTPYMVIIPAQYWMRHKIAYMFFFDNEFGGEIAINDLGDGWNEVGPFIVFPKFRNSFLRHQSEIFEAIIKRDLEEFLKMKFVWCSHNPAALRSAFKLMDQYFMIDGCYKLNFRPTALRKFEIRLALSPWFVPALIRKFFFYVGGKLDKSSSKKKPPTSFAYDPDKFD